MRFRHTVIPKSCEKRRKRFEGRLIQKKQLLPVAQELYLLLRNKTLINLLLGPLAGPAYKCKALEYIDRRFHTYVQGCSSSATLSLPLKLFH